MPAGCRRWPGRGRTARCRVPSSGRRRRATAWYLDPAGHAPLRAAIAQWLLVSRGIRCEAQQVIVTSGSQQAIDLIGRLLLDVGDEVMVEDPGYPGIRASLLGQGAVVRPVAVDDEGLCIAAGAARWPAARNSILGTSVPASCARA